MITTRTSPYTLFFLTILSLVLIGYLALQYLYMTLETAYAKCDTQCELLAEAHEPYYATYEKGSKEYYWAYCSQMAGTIDACK